MRRSSSSPSIQLFPFLAVLVCAMGALILLLLVTTRKMQRVAVARAEAEEEMARELQRPAIPKAPAPSSPPAADLAAAAARRKARQAELAAARRRQSARELQWQRELAELQIALDQRRERVTANERELRELQDKLQATETNLQQLADRKSQLKSDLDKDKELRTKIELEHQQLTDAITRAQKQMGELRRAHADAASKFAFIPYDGASGTTRRPVYIECTSGGIRFQPENVLLDENDLKGFTETFNPLLVASQRLMQYWREQAVATDDPRSVSRPYVLLVVRPKGTIAYYVARKMLSQLGDDFGYELINEDFELQLPPADPMAKATIQRAVADTLKNRGEMLAAGGRIGEPRLGEVLMGRNEELIEFGTLDDRIAAHVAQEENPFQKNSGSKVKSFSVTRSPVNKDELTSGPYKSTLAERERRRAHGVADSLDGMVRGGNGTGTRGTDSRGTGARGTGPRGTGSGGVGDGYDPTSLSGAGPAGPGGDVFADESGQPGRPSGTSTEFALADPFSREQRATGRQGVGVVESDEGRGERTAGDSSEAGEGEPHGQFGGIRGATNARGSKGSRNVPGAAGQPAGAKQAKVFDIPAANGSGDAFTGGTGQRTSPRSTGPRGVPGGQPAAGSDPTADDSVAGDPESTSATGDIPAGPRSGSPSGSRGEHGQGTSSRAPSRVEQAFRKPTPPAADAVQGTGDPTNSPRSTAGQSSAAGQRGGTLSRSTDPNAAQNRVYGDNPEARQQLSASTSSASVAQKRDAGRRRWGGSNTGQIGFERKVRVELSGDRVFIEGDVIEVVIEPGTTGEELVQSVLSALDEYSQTWPAPPKRFYWVPYLNFEVYSSGTTQYERLHAPLRDWGVFSEAKFIAGERPARDSKQGQIVPISKTQNDQAGAPAKEKATSPAKSPAKLHGPAIAPPKTDNKPAAKGSYFNPLNWFR